jgi:hypothetical protein
MGPALRLRDSVDARKESPNIGVFAAKGALIWPLPTVFQKVSRRGILPTSALGGPATSEFAEEGVRRCVARTLRGVLSSESPDWPGKDDRAGEGWLPRRSGKGNRNVAREGRRSGP